MKYAARARRFPMRTSAPVIAAITAITAIELVGCAKKPVAKEPSPEPEMTAARMNGRVNIAKEIRLRCSIQVNDIDRAPKFDFDEAALLPEDRDVLEKVARCVTTGPMR